MSGLPFQTSSQVALLTLPDKTALCNAFVGKPISSVRSPAAIIDRSRYNQNCQKMISRASQAGARFRCHVKTHKTIEGVELQVGSNGAVVCSTMVECAKIIGSHLCKPNGKVRDVSHVSVASHSCSIAHSTVQIRSGALWRSHCLGQDPGCI